MFMFQESSTQNNDIFYNFYSNKRKAVVFQSGNKSLYPYTATFSLKTIEDAVT